MPLLICLVVFIRNCISSGTHIFSVPAAPRSQHQGRVVLCHDRSKSRSSQHQHKNDGIDEEACHQKEGGNKERSREESEFLCSRFVLRRLVERESGQEGPNNARELNY